MDSPLDPPRLLASLSANPWFGSLPLAQRKAMLAKSAQVHVRAG